MWEATLVAAVLVLWLIYRKTLFSVLKKSGINGPEPNVLFGNSLELTKKTPLVCIKEWTKKYGKVFGYYNGLDPVVVISDLDMLKRIQISEFHKFINRPYTSRFQTGKNSKNRVEGFSDQLVTLRDKKWKDSRSIITPSFTVSKMKMIAPIINNAIDSLVKIVGEKSKSGQSFDIYPLYQGLTMDVIGRTAFGINTNVQNNPNDPFLLSARYIFSVDNTLILMLTASFPTLRFFWEFLSKLRILIVNKGVSPLKNLIRSVKSVIAARRKNTENRRPDLLQLMIDAKGDESSSVTSQDLTASDDNEIAEKNVSGSSTVKQTRRMTDEEVLDNSVLFFLAGYETTSTALAYTTHFLVNFPEVQEKVRNEVQELLKTEGDLNYTSLNKLQYLDQVLHESLRLYPPIYLFVNRESAEEVDFGTFSIPKGTAVQAPTFEIQRDPDYWPNPEKFIPERFSPENKSQENSLAFQAFGNGPRNCVGMRFAKMEAKLALAQLLTKYKLVSCKETEKEPLTLKVNRSIINPKNGIWLKAVAL